MTTLLSIITITCNNGAGLSKTVRSCERLLANPQIELVVVDGASTDDTASRLAQWRLKLAKNITVLSEPDQGIYDAMNKGLRLARGQHVVFMNAGDCFSESFGISPSSLQCGITYYGDAEFRSNVDSFLKHYSIDGIRSFLSHNTFCHQAIFYPRTMLLEIGGYDTAYKISSDFDLTLKCFLRGLFVHLDEVVCVCELGGFSHINGWRSYKERMKSIKTNCNLHWWLLLLLYAPVFFLKHRVVKTLDGSRLLSWYRSVRYR